jgi:hypothetical protein
VKTSWLVAGESGLVADEVVADEVVADEVVADEVVADEVVADEVVADAMLAEGAGTSTNSWLSFSAASFNRP